MDTTRTQNQLEIHVVPIKKTVLLLRAINHPLRQQMLKLIHEESKITVTELYDILALEQSVASQHLAILRRAGLVSTKRQGKFIYYSIDYSRMVEVHDFSESIIG